jgi:GNAT superfamily N-acetyltransferase
VCRRYLGLVADLHDLLPDRRRRPEIRVTQLDVADVPALRTLDHAMTRREVARRLEEGQRGTLGWWGRDLAHIRWDSTSPVYLPYLGRVLWPGPGDQVVVGIHTAPAFRGLGIAGAVMMEASWSARAAGVSRLVWLAAWWNRRSQGLAGQIASRAVGTVGYWALGPYRQYFASGQVWLAQDASVRLDAAESGVRPPEGSSLSSPPSRTTGQC